ncbi:unnamed protein product [Litomosoides sigmodontis]|uniref:Ribosomal protein eL8/eL30/eS12/Gadd45 domain-containing protein n=1 Tax=Litomosoides sigmodontis TaxID=42156 RepID=A0A3P6V4B9_LITSI|nr:unnamed protein product [Litomosoides sigmodontis]
MYWSVVLEQLTVIVVAMSYNANTFACFSNSGFCSCPTSTAGCLCSQHLPLQPKTFIPPPVPLKLPSLLLSPSSSYSAPYPPYLSHQPISLTHPQRYNFLYTSSYNAPQSVPQQSVLHPLSSYNSERSIGNLIGTSGNYYPPSYNIYEIHSKKLRPNTIGKIRSISETQKHTSEQIEVQPSIISSEHSIHANEMTTVQRVASPTAATLVAQNIIVVPHRLQTTTPTRSTVAVAATMTNTITRNNATEMSERDATAMQKHRLATNQNYRSMSDSRRRAGKRLSLCSKNIGKFENHSGNNNNNILIECNGLLGRTISSLLSSKSSSSNDGLNENGNRMEVHALNGRRVESNSILNRARINVTSVRSGIRTISQTQSLKHFKSAQALSPELQKKHHSSDKLMQKQRNFKTDGSMSQKAMVINLAATEQHVSQNRKTAFGKPTFKEILSSGWTGRSDRLLSQAFGRTRGLHNVTKRIDYDNNFYTTYHHQSCIGQILGYLRNGTIISVAQKCEELKCDATNVKLSDDHILEIIFLKNITGRYRNYGNYCVSKKSVGQISSGRVIFEANMLSRARRLYDRSTQQGVNYGDNGEANQRKRSVKQLLTDVRERNGKAVELNKFVSFTSTTTDVDIAIIGFLKKVKKFQDRAWKRNPIKARSKRRLVCGLREVRKQLLLKAARCIILARDIETNKVDLAADVDAIKELCASNHITFFWISSKHSLSRALNKSPLVSAVAILDCSGAEDAYNMVLETSANFMTHCRIANHIDQSTLFA